MALPTKITNSFVFKYRDALLFMTCCVLVFFLVRKPKQVTIVGTDPLALQQLKQIKDENNKMYAQIAQQLLERAQADKYTDSLAKALRIEKKNIKTVDKIVTKDSIVYVDNNTKPVFAHGNDSTTIVAYSTSFHDAWVDIKAIAGKDTGSIHFTSNDTLTRVETVENHLFKPTEHFVFIGNANPHNEIKQGASFKIQEKKPFLTVGPYIGYDAFSNRFSGGISVQLPIIQIKR